MPRRHLPRPTEAPATGSGSRSRTCSTRPGSRRRTAPRSSPATSRPRRRRRCGCSRPPATRTSARRTCTSSRTARPRRTRTSAPCRTRAAPGRVAGGSSGGSAAALVRGPRGRGARHRLGRLDPHPRRLLRGRRLQADVRARAARRLLAARGLASTTRADGARRRDVHGDARGARARVRAGASSSRSRSSRVGVAWTEHADPLVRERVEAAAAASPTAAAGRRSRS